MNTQDILLLEKVIMSTPFLIVNADRSRRRIVQVNEENLPTAREVRRCLRIIDELRALTKT